MPYPTRAEVNELIAERLAADPSFRGELLADPRSAVGALLGVEVPDGVTIAVHEEALTDIHIVIPKSVGDELPDEDLDLVAGGGCWDNCTCNV